jgi:hypothetical protein
MAHSYDYHLGIPHFINKFHKYLGPNTCLHANISGLGEVYNLHGIIVYSDVICL